MGPPSDELKMAPSDEAESGPVEKSDQENLGLDPNQHSGHHRPWYSPSEDWEGAKDLKREVVRTSRT